MNLLKKLRIDPFILAILAAVITASFLPAQDKGAVLLSWITHAAIALLFFMHGAKLSRQAIIGGMRHWRLHILVLTATFVFFPLMSGVLSLLPASLVPPELMPGILFLCAMPATVQSAIAFTSAAGGNVAAAVCSASFSSLLGIVLSPLILGFTMHLGESRSTGAADSVKQIALQLLLPFALGHLSRPVIGSWIDNHRKLLKLTDNSSIVLIVYGAFSAAVLEGLWQKVPAVALLQLLIICTLLLAVSLSFTTFAARLFGFSKEDEITIVFCGSKKSLANGVPMANILFPAAQVGLIILPLMLFHQIQLMACSVITGRYAKRLKPVQMVNS